ncbi:hypothetical protein C1Y23_06845 [Pseudomonas sp. GW460-12]|uniref:Uncharacterized protein n=1 Tax=Pseudomonas veronii TaxID=76761 RepID=A0A5M8EPB7_PSEVE|nr:hypothetical protein F3K53_21575 [Pseudomonas veronii]PMX18103.1 hypothetical protein C1Y25_03160 [Pseudomonas sp. MPBC4-3]PMX27956.1 hypothetical protein C1Y23_06845 [Pseudomonas sp. GW460-12]PMX37568.1 hypothetical protein C1Y24_02310 [Pseudomonas sp. MPR-R2A4]PMX50642.1 hypothetical protein C1Y20_02270 [Pseudomonas sp. FW301-21B01]PMX55589.1 hypothetical protein C1Y17_02560 [Pseudomonas sp. MPR-R2A6]PMX93719.1 hypothetical protein C1Y21_02160 [Pseudomonas sp. MPR-R2A3]PMY16790.1 hypoth
MDNFMEQPTYKMNRGAILAQGCGRFAGGLQCGRRLVEASRLPQDQVISAVTGASRPMACKRA